MELIARLVVGASCLALLVVGLAVLVREGRAARPEPLERAAGPLALVNFVAILGFVAVGLAAAVTTLGTIPALLEPLGGTLRAVGIFVLAAAGGLAMWGIRSIGRQMSSHAEVRPDTELVTSGAFGLVRHPLYLSLVMLWAGGALALLSPVLAACCLVLVPTFVARSRLEEEILGRHFGAAYGEYARRVPMLLPRPWRARGR